ncbi:MAG: MalY/PatB family protein [Candidatus Kryptoniota bacterium]
MPENFDRIVARRNTDSLKWDTYPEDVIPLWVADMDFQCPQPVITALQAAVQHGVFGYPIGLHNEPSARLEMRQIIVERMARLYDWHIQMEDILFVPGVVVGFNQVVQAFAEEGGEVLVQPPVYPPILSAAQNAHMRRVEAPLIPRMEGKTNRLLHYEIDFEEFEKAISPQTKVFILCNPHNPSGRVFTKTELERMGEICLHHKMIICSDEIHNDLIFTPNKHIPIAALDKEIAWNSVTLMAPSKTFNIPGLEFSFAIVPNPEIRQRMLHAGEGLVGWINSLGWVAAAAAYREGAAWLAEVLKYLQANRDFLVDWLETNIPEIYFTQPEGTYLAWLDMRPLGLKPTPFEFFLQKARVAFNDGKTFGNAGEGFVRLNFGTQRSILQEALERMALALKER